MRKALAILVLAALAAGTAGGATASSGHRIVGAVRDLTCPGPCRKPPHPPLYTGGGLTVRVRALAGGRLVAVRHPDSGRFKIRVPRGRYRVSAGVAGRCWAGSHRRVRVRANDVRVRLGVRNTCIR